MATIGELGERLVLQWLQDQGWIILAYRWRCPWGEIDLIARSDLLAFVEVKTRSRGNWDADGLLAITKQKQRKLSRCANYFLSTDATIGELPCRFDVALVSYYPLGEPLADLPSPTISLGQPFLMDKYQLVLHQYLESAFDVVS